MRCLLAPDRGKPAIFDAQVCGAVTVSRWPNPSIGGQTRCLEMGL